MRLVTAPITCLSRRCWGSLPRLVSPMRRSRSSSRSARTGQAPKRKSGRNWATQSSIATGSSTTMRRTSPTSSKSLDGPGGVPFLLNRLVAEADILLATGRVEPHQYAGFSGGGKTIAIGCASDAIIAYTHGPAMLDRPGTRLAQLAGNPVSGSRPPGCPTPPIWHSLRTVVLDDDERPVAIAYGAPEAVQDHLADIASQHLHRRRFRARSTSPIAGVGYPEGRQSLSSEPRRQLSAVRPVPVVRPGGVIIIPAACPEGAGEGAGEQPFPRGHATSGRSGGSHREARAGWDSARVNSAPTSWRRCSQDVSVIVAGAEHPEEARAIGCLPAADMESALAMAVDRVGTPASALIVPHALLTLPIVGAGHVWHAERVTLGPLTFRHTASLYFVR